jgi:hypothetical protein
MKKLAKSILIVSTFVIIFTAEAFITVNLTMKYATDQIYNEKLESFKYGIDNSLPLLTFQDNISILLDNPDRGWRMETYLTLGTNISYPNRNITNEFEEDVPTLSGAYTELQKQLDLFAPDRPKIIQQYVYLTLYRERSTIPDKALTELKEYFEYIRSLNMKILLRFAYRTDENKVDPTQDVLLAHIAKLQEWFQNNTQLVADTVYCLQLGFFGYWGEGWGYTQTYDIPLLIEAVMEMIPSWMYMNVRTLEYYENTPPQYRSRVGIHDDLLVGNYDPYATVLPEDKFTHPYYRDLFQKTINDGELAWGMWRDRDDDLDGKSVTQYIYDYSLSTLSIVHNYIEVPNRTFNMYRWKSENLTAQIFKDRKWNYNPNLLNEKGEISIFEYLKFHLGYQLVLSNLTTDNGKLKFMISNYGFAAPFNMDKLVLQVKNKDTSINYINFTYTPHGLYTFGQLVYSVSLNFENIESVSVKLFNSKNTDYVRFGNNITSNNGYYKIV